MVATLIFTENQTSKTIMGIDLSCKRACLNDLPRKSNFLQADMFGEEVMVLLEMVLNEKIGGKANDALDLEPERARSVHCYWLELPWAPKPATKAGNGVRSNLICIYAREFSCRVNYI